MTDVCVERIDTTATATTTTSTTATIATTATNTGAAAANQPATNTTKAAPTKEQVSASIPARTYNARAVQDRMRHLEVRPRRRRRSTTSEKHPKYAEVPAGNGQPRKGIRKANTASARALTGGRRGLVHAEMGYMAWST